MDDETARYLSNTKMEALAALRQNPHGINEALDHWSYEVLLGMAQEITGVADLDEQSRATYQAKIWAALINAFAVGYGVGRDSAAG